MKNQKSKIKLKTAAIVMLSIVAIYSCKKKEVSKYENTKWKITYADQTDHLIGSDSMETTTFLDTTFSMNSNNDTNLAKMVGMLFEFNADGKGVVTKAGKSENITWKDANGQIIFTLPKLVGDKDFEESFNVSNDMFFKETSDKVIMWSLKLKGNSMNGTYPNSFRLKRFDEINYKLEKM